MQLHVCEEYFEKNKNWFDFQFSLINLISPENSNEGPLFNRAHLIHLRRWEMFLFLLTLDGSSKKGNEKQIDLCFKTIIMSLLPSDITR